MAEGVTSETAPEGTSPPPFRKASIDSTIGSTLIAPQETAWAGNDSNGPSSEIVVPSRPRFSLSRARLVGWGALAFSAGLVASAGAHLLVAPSRPSSSASATLLAPRAPVESAPAVAVIPPTPSPAAAAVPAPAATVAPAAAPAPVAAAAEAVPATAPVTLAAATPAPLRTRAGATPQPRSKTRARGKVRAEPRGSSGPTETAEADWAPAAQESTERTTERAAPAARASSSWVDPFAQ